MISALDTHETVKRLTAAGFTDAQAEALTTAVKQAVDIDLSNLATKTDIADVRREMAEMAGLWLPACEAVRKLAISWIGIVRPSRQLLRSFLRMRKSLMPSKDYLMLRAPAGRVSKHAPPLCS